MPNNQTALTIPVLTKMSATKASVVEEAGVSSMPAKKSFGARVAAHFKKWWWAHLIAFIIALLVIILPV